jgi:hypothetical protein
VDNGGAGVNMAKLTDAVLQLIVTKVPKRVGHVACMGKPRNVYKLLVGTPLFNLAQVEDMPYIKLSLGVH